MSSSRPQYFGIFLGTFRAAAARSQDAGVRELKNCVAKIVACNPGLSLPEAFCGVINDLQNYPREQGQVGVCIADETVMKKHYAGELAAIKAVRTKIYAPMPV